ncbi:hypothetical protein DERP_015442 [Dermatophagoides pteronyssinus]|uniref:Reverse transcriptase Ty1/copia-type domain-containing protein n=1 Tax=Dermatophagoides pteronyssinus TaxID=6956 RepID=A0ABQ8JG30_DERPT|nr:hypothetical protein DERP_015442 [Dermatophagoides pteronyssinus]
MAKEFDNYQLMTTLKKRGIKFLTSTPHTPQQNVEKLSAEIELSWNVPEPCYLIQSYPLITGTWHPRNYFLLDPRNGNIFKSCNVTFDESKRGYIQPSCLRKESVAKDEKSKVAAIASKCSSNQIDEDDPKTYQQAMGSINSVQWQKAIDKEISDLIQKVMVVSKARLVVRGFEQYGSNNNYAPTLNISSLKTFLTLALSRKMMIKQCDVSAAFLNSKLDTEIYVTPPDGINTKYWRLNKALYGLKEAPRAWYQTLHDYLVNDIKLKCSLVDQCIFYSDNIMIAVYVDDIIIAADSTTTVDQFISNIKRKFEIHDYADYIDDALERFGMSDCNPVLILMDAFEDFSNCEVNNRQSRPDISVCVSHLGAFADRPSEELWKACKKNSTIFEKGTKNRKLRLLPVENKVLNLFTDASLVCWSSKKQTRLTHSTCEAELVAALDGWKQAEPIRQLLTEVGFLQTSNFILTVQLLWQFWKRIHLRNPIL